MDKFLAAHWDKTRAPVVTCTHYQTSSAAHEYRLDLSAEGVELRAFATGWELGLFPRKNKREHCDVIPWSDVLGASVLSADSTEDASSNRQEMVFAIYACLASDREQKRQCTSDDCTKNADRTPTDRTMAHWIFRYSGANAAKLVPTIVSTVQHLADPRSFASSAARSSIVQLRRRKYIVYINPVGGAGRAKHTYKTVVAPVLLQSNIDCEVIITQHPGHATEHIMEAPICKYDCVVSVGGDGLLSELLQGIMKRSDWKKAIRVPLGIIPGGSGNGLSCSLLSRARERFSALNAAYALAKGMPQDLDISTVLNGHQEVVYSFLSLEWAFVANLDIDSERYRMFGGLRFTITAVAKVLANQQRFSGTIRYLSSDHDSTPPPRYHERDHGFDGETAPALDCFATLSERKEAHVKGEWKELKGDFHLFWGMNVSHASSDAQVVPGAAIDDGYYYLFCAPFGLSRIDLARLLLGLESGSHLALKQVQLVRTRAFTLHVDDATDLLVVDGEIFKGPHLQVEVHRALGQVLCLPPST